VCDFSQSPSVCATQGPAPADAAEIDARPGAADAAPKPDAASKPDAAPTPDAPDVIDAAPPDATVDAAVDAM
jgi:hypothetical protein